MNLYDLSDAVILAFEVVFKASLLLGFAAFIVSKLRQRFPSTAHLTWVLAFAIILVLPVASLLLPGRSVLFLSLRNAVPHAAQAYRDPAKQPIRTVGAAGRGQSTQTPFVQSDPGPAQPPTLLVLILNEPWAVAALIVWLIGFLAVAGRSGYGFYCLRMIRRFGTNPIEDERRLLEADRLASETGVKRSFDLRICATSELPIPMTWGIFRPTIVLPRDAEAWSDKRFEATMLHELSHVRRYDFATQFMAEVICALYWFNPLVWLSARTMRSDAELAADEAVLHSGLKPSDYAAELLSLAADLGKKPIPFATLGTPAMTNSKIETRLESILAPTAGRRGITSIQVLAAWRLQ